MVGLKSFPESCCISCVTPSACHPRGHPEIDRKLHDFRFWGKGCVTENSEKFRKRLLIQHRILFRLIENNGKENRRSKFQVAVKILPKSLWLKALWACSQNAWSAGSPPISSGPQILYKVFWRVHSAVTWPGYSGGLSKIKHKLSLISIRILPSLEVAMYFHLVKSPLSLIF